MSYPLTYYCIRHLQDPGEPFCAVKLSKTAHNVLIRLASFADDDGTNCRPFQETLARLMNVSRVTINTAIQELKEKGVIQVHQNGDGNAAEYQIMIWIDRRKPTKARFQE